FFPSIVTTHTWNERFDTCTLVRDVGMELCCGVLLGMGESDQQRIELIGQLREAQPAEVPINFLNPRPGTPLGDRPLVEPPEPIRYCPRCGRRMTVLVTPTRTSASCREHGHIDMS